VVTDSAAIARVEQHLLGNGYRKELVRTGYRYSVFDVEPVDTRQVALAAFYQEPMTAQTACIGVVEGEEPTAGDRFLGAPVFIEVVGGAGRRWKITATGPQLQDKQPVPLDHLFQRHGADWSPERIFRAKSISQIGRSAQLDFVDVGLLPAIEREAGGKLDSLIGSVLEAALDAYEDKYPPQGAPVDDIYRMLFRLITAKALSDMQVLPDLDFSKPWDVVRQVEKYTHAPSLGKIDEEVLRKSAQTITRSFPFYNLSVNTLAYVYENTLVSSAARKARSIHLTPPYLVDYILDRLPLEALGFEGIRVTDPMCGAGTFLVASIQKLRALLPPDWGPSQRHKYFADRMKGRDIDPFAVEVAKCALTLADLPNPDGWDLEKEDVYAKGSAERLVQSTTVLVTNPPFEAFSKDERTSDQSELTKPAELLARALPALPDGALVGLVLPLAFLDGVKFSGTRKLFKESFRILELLTLPDKVFDKADSEVAVALACKDKTSGSRPYSMVYRAVTERAFDSFRDMKSVSRDEEITSQRLFREGPPHNSFWVPTSWSVWDRLEGFSRLGGVVGIHKGVEYKKGVRSDREPVRHGPFAGAKPGLHKVRPTLSPFLIKNVKWLATDEEFHRGDAWGLPWSQAKVFLNVAPRRRGPWRLTAARDKDGLVATERFFGIWLTGTAWSLLSVTALLNSAIANAFVYEHEGKRVIRKETLAALPLPPATPTLLKTLEELAAECERLAAQSPEADLKDLLLQTDAELLKAYDLPPREEKRLLDVFLKEPRPGCQSFTGFYPPDFAPAIPLHMYLSTEFGAARSDRVLSRLPVVDDPAITDMLRHLLGAD